MCSARGRRIGGNDVTVLECEQIFSRSSTLVLIRPSYSESCSRVTVPLNSKHALSVLTARHSIADDPSLPAERAWRSMCHGRDFTASSLRRSVMGDGLHFLANR
jgi:hypothetical protein